MEEKLHTQVFPPDLPYNEDVKKINGNKTHKNKIVRYLFRSKERRRATRDKIASHIVTRKHLKKEKRKTFLPKTKF